MSHRIEQGHLRKLPPGDRRSMPVRAVVRHREREVRPCLDPRAGRLGVYIAPESEHLSCHLLGFVRSARPLSNGRESTVRHEKSWIVGAVCHAREVERFAEDRLTVGEARCGLNSKAE